MNYNEALEGTIYLLDSTDNLFDFMEMMTLLDVKSILALELEDITFKQLVVKLLKGCNKPVNNFTILRFIEDLAKKTSELDFESEILSEIAEVLKDEVMEVLDMDISNEEKQDRITKIYATHSWTSYAIVCNVLRRKYNNSNMIDVVLDDRE